MRVSRGGIRRRRSRALALGAVALLTLSLVGSGSVLGAPSGGSSRTVYIGSLTGFPDTGSVVYPGGDSTQPPTYSGVLLPSPVNVGFATVVPIQVLNADNQTVAHVSLSFPAAPDPTTGTAGSLAPGLTITNVGGTDAAACPNFTQTLVTCDFSNLPAGGMRSIYVVVAVAQSFDVATQPSPLFTTSTTTNNENGSNTQYFTATSGTFAVSPASLSGLNDFVPPGQAKQSFTTGNAGSAKRLQTQIDFTTGTNGNFVGIKEDSANTYVCPTALVGTCQPFETTITVTDGLTSTPADLSASPFLTVTLTAKVDNTYTLSKAFVAHFTDSTTVPDWILFWKTKSTQCGSNVAQTLSTMNQCFYSATLSKKADADGFYTAVLVVIQKHNGTSRM